jgi:antitoxin HigA-1
MMLKQHNPPHPGEFIREVYLKPSGLIPSRVARALNVHPSTFIRLLNAKSDVSPKMAIKLSIVLGRSPESWLAMQHNFDLARTAKTMNMDKYEALVVTAGPS